MRISVSPRRRCRISSCPAEKGIRWVNPSSATESPSCTNSAAASRNDTRVATVSPRSLRGSDPQPAKCLGESRRVAAFLSRPIIEIACAYRPIRVSCAVSGPSPRRASMPRPAIHKSAKRPKPTKAANRAAPPQLQLPAKPPAVPNPAGAPPTPSAQIDAPTAVPDFMTSLARGLAVIQAFSQKKRQLTISQVSNKTGFSRAAVRRCLYTLAKLGFAGSDDNRHFFLQPRVLALGHSYISSMPLATAAHPILERFSRMMHESCSIATLDGLDIVYVARANVTRIMAIDLGVGSRLPAFCTSMGRVLLANLPPDKLESFLARIQFTRHTERTIVTADKLRPVLRLVLRNGYSIVDQELELGLRSMAVPILSPSGQVVAAVNVGAQELCMLLR